MILLDRMIVGGIRFVLDKIVTAVDQERNDDTRLRERLLEAQMRHELGEIPDEELASTERDVLARLRAIQEERQGGELGPISWGSGVTVEASLGGDEGPVLEESRPETRPEPAPKKRKRSRKK